MTTAEIIQEKLAVLEPQRLELVDDSGRHVGHAGARDGGGHYNLVIVSALFDGKPAQARHRMVYAALDGLMGHQIHALSIKAYTSTEIAILNQGKL